MLIYNLTLLYVGSIPINVEVQESDKWRFV